MSLSEISGFIMRRARRDTFAAFIARMVRFAIIGAHLPLRIAKERKFHEKPDDYVEVKLFNGCLILVDTKDAGISVDLYLDGIREPFITEALQHEIKRDDVVLDIGANIGYYVLQEAIICGGAGKVYAIEPVPANVELLKRNVERNRFLNVEIYNCAIGNSNRRDVINISPLRNMCSMIKKEGYREYIGQVPIQVVTVDTFLKDKLKPDLIRMDVEGYEYEILQGMTKLLDNKVPLKLFIEVHFDILMDKIILMVKLLKEKGFEIKVATYEPHASLKKSPLLPLARFCEGVMGAKSGQLNLKMDDLFKREFRTGQVEDLEIIFERK